MAVIGIMDSGVGGLSVFKEILKLLPNEKYIYFSDNAWCPYGEKTSDFITKRVREVIKIFVDKGADAVVIACNTATGAAAKRLRSEFNIPIVGIEPAIKPASKLTKSGVIGVLATAGTLKGKKYHINKSRFTEEVDIIERVGEGFVELVENLDLDSEKSDSVVRNSLQPLLDAGADVIVLGCTHYPFLIKSLRRVAGPEIKFIDPSEAVARHLLEMLEEKNIGLHQTEPDVELISSGSSDALERLFKLILSSDQ